jgi:hypothetical protein
MMIDEPEVLIIRQENRMVGRDNDGGVDCKTGK